MTTKQLEAIRADEERKADEMFKRLTALEPGYEKDESRANWHQQLGRCQMVRDLLDSTYSASSARHTKRMNRRAS